MLLRIPGILRLDFGQTVGCCGINQNSRGFGALADACASDSASIKALSEAERQRERKNRAKPREF